MSRLLSIENNTNGIDGTSSSTSHYGMNSTIYSDEFWTGFERFLSQTNNHRSTKDRLKYVHIIQKGDAQELLVLSNDKRIHAIESFALAKYTGCYDKWNQINL